MKRLFTIVFHAPSGGNQSWKFEGGAVVLGADEACEVSFTAEGVSPKHARLTFGDEAFVAEDLGSPYGMLVDGERVDGAVEAFYPASLQMGEAVLSVSVERVGSGDKPVNVIRTSAGDDAPKAWQPEVGGTCSLSREFARGGMSRIYEGEDPQLRRRVAVKVSRLDRGQSDERFFKEAEVLAQLAHPNIVPVYCLGRDEAGRPAYSMKLVKGRTLQSILEALRRGEMENEFALPQLLIVFLKVCDAVSFAHSRGYLHRDLKPENVMVGEFGEVLVMDWGLASRIGDKDEVEGGAGEISKAPRNDKRALDSTMDGDVVGTPQYMSPEQAAGKRTLLTPRSDIYALGAILYSILTLRPPVEGKTLDEVLRNVQQGRIAPISRYVRKGAGGDEEEKLPEALGAVTKKAMQVSEKDRYQTVEALVADIQAFQGGFATSAENASFLRHLLLLVRRHRMVSVLFGVLSLAGPTFTLMLAASERAAKHSARIALEQGQLAKENARIAQENAQMAEENARMAQRNERKALEGQEAARQAAAHAQLNAADASWRDLNGIEMKRALDAVPEDLRDKNWDYLSSHLDTSFWTLKTRTWFGAMVAHPKKAHVFVTIQDDGVVRAVDVETKKVTDLFKTEPDTQKVWRMAISDDAEKLAIATMHHNGIRFVVDKPPTVYLLKDGTKLCELPVNKPPSNMTFSPDGTLLLVGELYTYRSQLWDLRSGEMKWEQPYSIPTAAKGLFSQDNRYVYAYAAWNKLAEINVHDGSIANPVFNAVDSEWVFRLPAGDAFFIGEKGVIRKRDPQGERILFENRPAGRGVFDVGYQIKEGRLVTLSDRGDGCLILQVWSGKTGALLRSELVMGQRGSMSVHPISGEVLIAREVNLKVWKFNNPKPSRELAINGSMLANNDACMYLGEPWRLLRTRGAPREMPGLCVLEVLDVRDKGADKTPLYQSEPIPFRLISGSREGNVFAGSSGEGAKTLSVYTWSDAGLMPVGQWPLEQKIIQLRVNTSGSRLWTGYNLFEPLTGRALATFERADVYQTDGGFSAWVGDNRLIEMAALLSKEPKSKTGYGGKPGPRTLILWDAETGRRLLSREAVLALSLSVSPDARWIAEGGVDYRVRIRDAETLAVVSEFRAHDGAVTSLAWHPTLPLLTTLSEDLSIKIWDTQTWQLKEEFRGIEERGDVIVISPDGTNFCVIGRKVWRMRFWEPGCFKGEKGEKDKK